jgi:hypothetical protein
VEVDTIEFILSDNLHYSSLKPFDLTEDSTALADVRIVIEFLSTRFSSVCS